MSTTTNGETNDISPPELDNLLKTDPYLEPYKDEIKRRYDFELQNKSNISYFTFCFISILVTKYINHCWLK